MTRKEKEVARVWEAIAGLQQIGDGWWRVVAAEIEAGSHKVVGMDRREFAARIGRRVVDPHDAIIELHRAGHSQQTTADILGISKATVRNVLIEGGEIEGKLDPKGALPSGTQRPTNSGRNGTQRPIDSTADEVDEEKDKLRRHVKSLEARVEGQKKTERKRETDDFIERERNKTDADRKREAKEREAKAAALGEPVEKLNASMAAASIVIYLDEIANNLSEAFELFTMAVTDIKEVAKNGGVSKDALVGVIEARKALLNEFVIAEARQAFDAELEVVKGMSS
jgi:hypothetical protein